MTSLTTSKRTPKIGDIYSMQFDGVGSEQIGWRPGVIFQNNVGNLHSPNLIVLPITSNLKKAHMPTHVFLSSIDTGLRCNSIVICENPQRLSKAKLGNYISTLSDKYMKEIAVAHLVSTAAISYLDLDSLVKAWQLAVKLNSVQ